MSVAAYAPAGFVQDLRAIAAASTDPGEIAARGRPRARDLALSRTWLEPRHYTCDPAQASASTSWTRSLITACS